MVAGHACRVAGQVHRTPSCGRELFNLKPPACAVTHGRAPNQALTRLIAELPC